MAPDPEPSTRALAERFGDWVLPYWLERQCDPASPSFVPASGAAPVLDLTHADVLPVGTLGSPRIATVDPGGLVTPWPGAWSLDWWVGADDRWHLPSREIAVRQSLVGSAPVVETSMRVPGGDVVERVWAFHDAVAGDVLAVEIENATRVPVAVSVAVRPYGPGGAVPVSSVAVDGDTVTVDGRLAAWLPRAAARTATSTWRDGDVASVVMAGDAAEATTAHVSCPDGFAQAALVFAVSHGTSLRLLVPMSPATPSTTGAPTAVPPADAVARGWASHAGRSLRVELPDPQLAEALAVARHQVLLAAAGRSFVAGDAAETAAVVRALDRCGLHDEADAIVATLEDGQGRGGRLGGDDPSDASTGAVLHAAGAHWRAGRETPLVDALAGPLAAGAHHRPGPRGLARRRVGGDVSPVVAGWQLGGALDAASALESCGQAEAGREIRRGLDALRVAVDDAMTGRMDLLPAGEALELLDLIVPLELVPASSDAAAGLIERIRAVALHEDAVVDLRSTGALSPERTARLGQAELRRGDREVLSRLRTLTGAPGTVPRWPRWAHPRTGGGVLEGWSPAASAAVVEVVLDLLAHTVAGHDGRATELVLCTVLPESWLGAGFEVHGLSSDVGVVSYAVRWHGERPALLWELTPHVGVGEVRVTAPGLDPSWSTTDVRGETLLGVPPAAASVVSADLGHAGTAPATAAPSDAAGGDGDAPGAGAPGPSEGESFG